MFLDNNCLRNNQEQPHLFLDYIDQQKILNLYYFDQWPMLVHCYSNIYNPHNLFLLYLNCLLLLLVLLVLLVLWVLFFLWVLWVLWVLLFQWFLLDQWVLWVR